MTPTPNNASLEGKSLKITIKINQRQVNMPYMDLRRVIVLPTQTIHSLQIAIDLYCLIPPKMSPIWWTPWLSGLFLQQKRKF